MNNLKIYIEESISFTMVKVYMVEKRPNMDVFYHMHNGKLIATEVEPHCFLDKKVKPLLTCPQGMFEPILKSFIQAVDQKGINTNNEHKLVGKLKATEYHLSDMRMITKKLLKIEGN